MGNDDPKKSEYVTNKITGLTTEELTNLLNVLQHQLTTEEKNLRFNTEDKDTQETITNINGALSIIRAKLPTKQDEEY